MRKIPRRNPSKREKIKKKLERSQYDEYHITRKIYPHTSKLLEEVFYNTFYIRHLDKITEELYTSIEFERQVNEIFRLAGNDWISLVNGKLMIIGNSAEEIEEKTTFKLLEKYERVVRNLEKAQKNLKDADWNDVPHYCCKAVERFYNVLLKNKKKYEDEPLSRLTKFIRDKKEKIFKNSVRGVKDGVDHLLLSAENLIGSIRNRRDSGHGNITDVPEWEIKMCYGFTILLLRTLMEFKK